MYLHLGKDVIIKTKNIVGIFDIETSTISNITRGFLSSAQKAGQIINVSMEMPKSFILCCEKKRKTVYISQISSATLLKRKKSTEEIFNFKKE